MKTIQILLTIGYCCLIQACTVAGGTDPSGAKHFFGAVGTDAGHINSTPSGFMANNLNNSKTAGVVTRTIGTVATTGLMVDGATQSQAIAEKGLTARAVSGDNTRVSINAAREATKQTKIATDAAVKLAP